MKLLFKERMFTWFDSYDIYDEIGESVYRVEGKMAWGHRLQIYDHTEVMIGEIREEVFTFLPCFQMYYKGEAIGEIKNNLRFCIQNFICHVMIGKFKVMYLIGIIMYTRRIV